jgi:hypothetical protein
MYGGFSDKSAHSANNIEIVMNFLKLPFVGDRREAKCSCKRCQNRMYKTRGPRDLSNQGAAPSGRSIAWLRIRRSETDSVATGHPMSS